MTTPGDISDEKIFDMTTFPFQWDTQVRHNQQIRFDCSYNHSDNVEFIMNKLIDYFSLDTKLTVYTVPFRAANINMRNTTHNVITVEKRTRQYMPNK